MNNIEEQVNGNVLPSDETVQMHLAEDKPQGITPDIILNIDSKREIKCKNEEVKSPIFELASPPKLELSTTVKPLQLQPPLALDAQDGGPCLWLCFKKSVTAIVWVIWCVINMILSGFYVLFVWSWFFLWGVCFCILKFLFAIIAVPLEFMRSLCQYTEKKTPKIKWICLIIGIFCWPILYLVFIVIHCLPIKSLNPVRSQWGKNVSMNIRKSLLCWVSMHDRLTRYFRVYG